MGRVYYTYYSYDREGRGYIGAKPSGSEVPEEDGYLGSFTDSTFSPIGKVILGRYDSGQEALEAEYAIQRLFNVGKSDHFVNVKIGGMSSTWADPAKTWARYTSEERIRHDSFLREMCQAWDGY